MTLPVSIDISYPDDPTRPGRKLHQQHHDVLHGFFNTHEDDPRVTVSDTPPDSPSINDVWIDTSP